MPDETVYPPPAFDGSSPGPMGDVLQWRQEDFNAYGYAINANRSLSVVEAHYPATKAYVDQRASRPASSQAIRAVCASYGEEDD